MNALKIWYDGKIMDAGEVNVSLLSFGLQYGWGVFEGIRAYETGSGPSVFRLKDHIDRLYRSASLLGLEISYSRDEVCRAVRETVAENPSADYIRPIAFAGEGSSLSLGTMDMPTHVAVAAVKMGEYVPGATDKGINIITSPWEKPRWRAAAVSAKICGCYVGLIRAKRDAMQKGADEALMLNSAGAIAEGSAENFFIVNNDTVSTPSLTSGILGGITRDTVMKLASDLGYEIEEREMVWDEAVSADEVFMCGTALEIQAVRSIDGIVIGAGSPGSITKQIMREYSDAARGRIPKYLAWCDLAEKIIPIRS